MIYNVVAPVVALVRADTPEAARQKLAAALTAAGFAVYDGEGHSAFESDDQDGAVDL